MRRVTVKRKKTESPPLSYEGAQALVEQSMKPLLARIDVLERELASHVNMLAAIKSAAGLALASDDSTKERLAEFLSGVAGIENRQADATLMEMLRGSMDNAMQEQMLAALRSRPNVSGTATGRYTSPPEERAPFTPGGVVTRDAAEAAARIASAYGMSTSQAHRAFYDAGSILGNFGSAEFRALEQALQTPMFTADSFSTVARRATGALDRTTEGDDMIENVSEDDDMPDLGD